MWTIKNRHRYDRDQLRYPSDLTDAEWRHIEPLIPSAKRGGGKRTVNMREVVNGVMYVLSTGCQWRYIPKDLPPRSTVNGYLMSVGLGRHAGEVASCALREMPSSMLNVRPARLSASSTAVEREKRGKRGLPDRRYGLRCRQADQWQKAPCVTNTSTE